jgi:hypothetical protein
LLANQSAAASSKKTNSSEFNSIAVVERTTLLLAYGRRGARCDAHLRKINHVLACAAE